MIIDSHLHTSCSHGTATVDEMVKESIKKGLSNIAFSEHFTYDHFINEEGVPTVQGRIVEGTTSKNFKQYCMEVNKANKLYKNKIKIRLGIEVDFIKGREREIRKSLESQNTNFDFIMGAIHFIGKPLKYFTDYIEEPWITNEYFGWLESSIKSKLFDIIAHPQLIQYYIDINNKEYGSYFERLADLLKTYKVAVDVNTDLWGSKGTYQKKMELTFLIKCKEKNIPLVLGSDAHSPEKIGNMFPAATKILKGVGIDRLYYFEKRHKIAYAI